MKLEETKKDNVRDEKERESVNRKERKEEKI